MTRPSTTSSCPHCSGTGKVIKFEGLGAQIVTMLRASDMAVSRKQIISALPGYSTRHISVELNRLKSLGLINNPEIGVWTDVPSAD